MASLSFRSLSRFWLASVSLAVTVAAGQSSPPAQILPQQALVQPKDLADLLSKSNRPRPTVICVGFHSLFVGAHVTGAIFAGPGSKPEGTEQLKAVVRNIPHKHPIVIYCGCCPFDKCPNVRPAYQILKELGFENVSVVEIPTNLHTDWVTKGFPTTKGAGY